MARVIGLTGGIASGKSTMARFFRDKGAAVLSADTIAFALAKPRQILYRLYVAHFGERILQADGTLDRRAIGRLVFDNDAERQWLDETTHPILERAMRRQIAVKQTKNFPVIILDVPLLFEAGWDKMTEENCLVFVDEAVQLTRLMRRNGYTEAEARARIAAQMPLSEKKKRADTFIDNNGSLEESFLQAEKLWKEWTHAGIS
ncbi:dephospho-CoA kinase [Selenomonas ruminantium]|uniref:Dephospho-CoA kinase n=1 Tax=Selenomonas ruminantium TaxID=971 RepID=A0A1H3VUX0_SELRU|nr:dephospho-CoA kinase [Selenomonas ruminantium]SDZ78481.1 dephospho-CoA kinase [Selenomonas ruminantium]